MEKDISILFVGKSLADIAGLSYVSASLLKRFGKEGYKIGYINIEGTLMDKKNIEVQGKDFKDLNIFLYNAPLLNKEKCQDFNFAIEDFKPNIVISINDPWLLDQFLVCPYKENFFWVNYTLFEVPIYPPTVLFPTPIFPTVRKEIIKVYEEADLNIPVTKMGKKTLENFKLKNISEDNVYLGIDLEDRVITNKTKNQVFKANIKNDDFVFMCMGVNNERKMMGRLLESFSIFLDNIDNKEKYKLYLHSDTYKFYGGTDLIQLAADLKLLNNVVFSQPGKIYDRKELMERYALCDCYISIPGGEGFGYGFLEAILHNKPVIYSSYGGHVEVCAGCGLEVPIIDYVSATNAHLVLGLADRKATAKMMEMIVKEEKIRKKYSNVGFEKVKENFDWDKQFVKFKNIVFSNYEIWNSYQQNKFFNKFNPKGIKI